MSANVLRIFSQTYRGHLDTEFAVHCGRNVDGVQLVETEVVVKGRGGRELGRIDKRLRLQHGGEARLHCGALEQDGVGRGR